MDSFTTPNIDGEDDGRAAFTFYYGTHVIPFELKLCEKAEKVQAFLHSKTGLQSHQLKLSGWETQTEMGEITLSELDLEKEYHVVVRAINLEDAAGRTDHIGCIYNILVDTPDHSGTLSFFFNGLQTVSDVRRHLLKFCSIPYHLQQWKGWPGGAGVTEETRLWELGLSVNKNPLRLRMVDPVGESSESVFVPPDSVKAVPGSVKANEDAGALDNQDVDFYGADIDEDTGEDLMDWAKLPKQEPLVSDTTLPGGDAVSLFEVNFQKRYGPIHVPFFHGTPQQAMTSAFDRPLAKRRLFFVYLHDDKSVYVNIFVQTVLQNTRLIDYVKDYANLWPCDVTLGESKVSAVTTLCKIVNQKQAAWIMSARDDSFPLLLLFTKKQSKYVHLLKIVDGTKSIAEVMDTLKNMKCLHTMTEGQLAKVERRTVHEIDQFLFLSGASGVRRDKLREAGITCIINCTVEFPNLPLGPTVEFMNIRIDDSPYALIGKYFDVSADLIEEQRKTGGKVLVHCMAGVSRSASIVLAYLVRHRGMSLRDAYALVRRKRSIIRPNVGFWKQLIEYEKHVRKEESVKMVPSAFGWLPDVYEEEMKPLSWVAIKNSYRL
ncbi:putative Dual specificity protein phosphatase 14 [Hypsibius exemplaris]|uniref:Dual specificity protein phosphatase 14 n=1 Tax=Hypsibius exemplaris TaxID=2072580 RepID=A0A1W0XCN3_HYPEX|nr:putative Dual specificity protein phosphatase 14 [Hypsibius exemplaris]